MVMIPRGLSADVILSGFEETSYPAVERIILPALRSRNISHIERLVIHRADVGAIKELMSLWESLPVDTVIYPFHLKNAIADFTHLQESDSLSQMPIVVTFGETPPSQSGQGMLVSSERIELALAGRHIVIAVEPVVGAAGEGLMIFSSPTVPEDEVELFHKETNAQVICAELVQKDGAQTFQKKEELTAVRESWLNILSEKGGVQIVPASFDSSSWLVIPAE